jgi:predicted RNase H-related nuclease YkuK (DUF458 family)
MLLIESPPAWFDSCYHSNKLNKMKAMKEFKTLHGTPVPDVINYIKEYVSIRENVEILIGSDSQCYGHKKTIYGVVIALYTPGKGAHVLCNKETLPMEYNTPVRLLSEVWRSIEVAEFLKDNGLPKPTWIDIDLNPDPKFKSNSVLRQAVGLVEGMGYKVRYKHLGALTTYAANHLVRI